MASSNPNWPDASGEGHSKRLKDFLADVLAVRSAKTLEVTVAVFSGIFNEAIDRGCMHENPVGGLLKQVLPPKRKRTRSTLTLSPERI